MPFTMAGLGSLSAVSAAVTTTVKITEKVFEIRAVGEQTRSLLATINQVDGQLTHAKSLRRQKSDLLSANEKSNIADTFISTEAALANVAALIERARVDAQVSGGQLRFNTRVQFVIRDSPNIVVSLTQLGIANQQLNTAVMILHSKGPRITVQQANITNTAIPSERKPPPSYEDSQFISASRNRNLRKRASAMTVQHPAMTTEEVHRISEFCELPTDEPGSRASSVFEVNFEETSITTSIADGLISLPTREAEHQLQPTLSGRQRSRRWLEIQSGVCS